MTRRVWTAGLAATAALLSVAAVGEGAQSPPLPVAAYYLARADPRLCPSPQCGGLFVHLANRSRTVCADGLRRPSCYVASADLSRLAASDARRSQLLGSISAGQALVRGVLVRGRVPGFPELDTLAVSEVWLASSADRPSGIFRRLRDNGIRCIAAPCFSTDALTLNPMRPGAHVTVSEVDLSRTGASAGAQRRALTLIARGGLLAAGKVLAVPHAGPAGVGRAFVASQVYIRAG